MMRTIGKAAALTGAAMAVFAAAAQVRADAIEDFYKGRTVTFLVAYEAGGGYGLYATLMAETMAPHIPGKPTVVVQYMPGAGGNVAANFLFTAAPRDGTMIGFLADALPVAQLLRPQGVRFNAREFNWVGTITPVNPVLVVRGNLDGVKTAEDLRRVPLNIGSSGRGSQTFIVPSALNTFAGAKFKIIVGYGGSNAQTLAMLQGELDAQSSAWPSWKARYLNLFETKQLIPVAQMGLKRDPDLPDVPLIQELTDDPRAKRAIEFLSAGSAIGRSMVLPPGVPEDRIAALRKAFMETTGSQAFKEAAAKRNAEINPVPGEEIQQVVAQTLDTPPELIEEAKKVFAEP
jgi:tripartite-type tricarboxylate transporter receptor subunit TctC